jgi:hypothetical protein
MPAYFIKIIVATAFLAAAVTSFLSMMALQGKLVKKTDPAKLKKIHDRSGIAALILLAPLIYLGARYLGQAGDALSVRAMFHVVLALTLVFVLGLKVLIALIYKNFLRLAPTLGMAVFVLALIVYAITAGFTVVMNIF